MSWSVSCCLASCLLTLTYNQESNWWQSKFFAVMCICSDVCVCVGEREMWMVSILQNRLTVHHGGATVQYLPKIDPLKSCICNICHLCDETKFFHSINEVVLEWLPISVVFFFYFWKCFTWTNCVGILQGNSKNWWTAVFLLCSTHFLSPHPLMFQRFCSHHPSSFQRALQCIHTECWSP